MHAQETDVWATLEQAYGFIGNSLLKPMNQTSDVGISADFWQSFPQIPTDHARAGLEKLVAYASHAATAGHEKAVETCAVEFTKLFIGPPSPAAPPWETMNKEGAGTVGFGQATFEMKQLLRAAGLELKNENNQYEDHLGIELLYLSVLAGRLASRLAHTSAENPESDAPSISEAATASAPDPVSSPDPAHEESLPPDLAAMGTFIRIHPLAWIEAFRSKVDAVYPSGYYSALVELAQGILEWNLSLAEAHLG